MLVAIVLIVILMFVLAGWAGFGLFLHGEKKKKEHEANADETMAELFNGNKTVVYSSPDTSGGLSIETLVEGANELGYRLVSDTGDMATRKVVFEKATG